jgi:hypothetical protein
MNKELIDKTRCILDFMEKADALVSEARRNGDVEREEHLLAGLSNAERDIRKYVPQLLGNEQDDDVPATGKEPPF